MDFVLLLRRPSCPGARFATAAVLGLLLAAPAAQAAPAGQRTDGRAARVTAAVPTGHARAGILTALTGLRAGQVRAVDTCPPAPAGHARCAAQALVLRATGRPVRPRVHRGRSVAVVPRLAGLTGAIPATGVTAPTPGTPAYLQQAYDLTFLSQIAGAGDTIAVVDAYDDPSAESDLATFRATYGLPACTSASGCFEKVNESGTASPLPAPDSGWEMEISLDLDAISSLCPNCHILLVEASSTSMSDMNQADITAAAMGARQISDSWSVNSSSPIPGTYTFPGSAVIAATGDSGYNGPGWDAYPAALPGVTAAGGTTLTASSSAAPSARGFGEAAWSLSGGWGGGSGCDMSEAKPSWQSDTGCTGRSYSDVSADGDPSTGLTVFDSGNGGWLVVGGTSLATPLVAAFEAVAGVGGTTPQWPYSDAALLNDPASGANGGCAGSIAYICTAGPGYDGPTGAGSISGDIVPGAPGIGGPSIGPGEGNTYAQSVAAGSTTLVAGIYPNGLATSYYWQYGPTGAYGSQTPPAALTASATPQSVTSQITGLAAGTTYHYRLVAVNSDGTSYGYDYTLTTAAGAPQTAAAPTLSGSANEGATLSASSGTWSQPGTYAYQWQRSGDGGTAWSSIAGATGTSYTLTASDVGLELRVLVSASNAYGTGVAASSATAPAAGRASAPAAGGTGAKGSRGHQPRTPGSSAVLTAGRHQTIGLNGHRLAVAGMSLDAVASAASHRRGHRRPATVRIVRVRRAAGVRGNLSIKVCAVGQVRHRGGACMRPVTLRSSVSVRVPSWMGTRVRVVIAELRSARRRA